MLLAIEHLDVVQQSLKTAQAHLKMVRDRYENGFIVKSDFLRMQVRVGELEQSLIESESNLEVARANLNATMGLPINRRFELVSSLKSASNHTESEIQGSVEKWEQTALSRRPDLEVLRYQEKMAEKEAIIEIIDLVKSFDGRRVLNKVNLKIYKGENILFFDYAYFHKFYYHSTGERLFRSI